MGLLDGLDLGGALRGALGAVEATALPAAINAQYLPDIVDIASPNGTLQTK